MELKEGMYVRTNDGYINKIKKVNQFNVLIDGRDLFGEELNIPNNEITKASHNIIDLIEVGDYVNGVEVISVDDEWITMGDTQVPILKSIANGLIKSIVTKEQFEQVEYIV